MPIQQRWNGDENPRDQELHWHRCTGAIREGLLGELNANILQIWGG